ncbi:MAG TPA: hypothetical protein VGS19_37900 [Streptosporangiaceae bacterium]|nr:hypothetical protein [Streptosporangiaceae bacterium]
MTKGEARIRSSDSLPPRSALPRGIEVPAIPVVGRTWYDRGPRYWVRRAGLALMWALLLTLIGASDAGFYGAVRHSSRTGFVVLLVINVALAVAAVVYVAVRTLRRWNVASLPGQARPPAFHFGQGRTGAVLSGFAQLGYWLVLLVAAFAMLVFPALLIALFLTSLMPEQLSERQARLWVAGQLREHGNGTPAG